MKKTPKHINVLDRENPARMSFYVPGHGIITRTKSYKQKSSIANSSSNAPKQTLIDSSDEIPFITKEAMDYYLKRVKGRK